MQSTAIVDLIIDTLAGAEEEARPAPALSEAFAGVPDPREYPPSRRYA
jgi:hypothetical protein